MKFQKIPYKIYNLIMLNFKNTPILIGLITITLGISVSCRTAIKTPALNNQQDNYSQINTLPRPQPDNRGIITYETYQVLIANGNETMAQIANRLELSGEKLALYNGLIPNYRPRKNEMVALPENTFVSSSGWSTKITREAIKTNFLKKSKISSANNPLRHRMQAGETIYTLSRDYEVSVNAIATWNGLGPDLDIKTGREIIIPAAIGTEIISSKKYQLEKNDKNKQDNKLDSSVVLSPKKNTQKEKQTSILKEKVNAPLKINPPKANIVSVKPFITPVKGTITNFYVQDKGSNNNNGIDYETKTEAPVKAVADGEIVLISDIVGGKGKIVLIRHTDELITIYGRLTNLEIKKGEKVTQGQKIGEVIKNESNNFGTMHFEVRQGMKSIDPETMLR